jgi:dCTP diphosphatase
MDPQGSTKGFVRVGDCPVVLDACRAACCQLYGLGASRPPPTHARTQEAGTLAVVSDLTQLAESIRKFNADRDWGKFHDPKSLLLALVGEVGELAELFQWLPAADARALVQVEPLHTRVGEEISDVLIYVMQLAEVCGVDLLTTAAAKLAAAELKFPADYFSGRSPDRASSK